MGAICRWTRAFCLLSPAIGSSPSTAGVKYNILRKLSEAGCEVIVVPPTTSPEEALAHEPTGFFCANGPGDPSAVGYLYGTLRELIGTKPLFGICLGHQMLSLAVGADTYKLKYGHRGGNQPVMNLLSGQVEITSQNHGFCVDFASIGPSGRRGQRRPRPRRGRSGRMGRGRGRAGGACRRSSAACS